MKPVDQRTTSEKSFLIKTLKNLEFFHKIKEKSEKDVFHKVFNELRHMFYPKQKIIYKNGDLIKKALMIIEGEIWSLSPKKDKMDSYISEKIHINFEKNKEYEKFLGFLKSNYPDYQIVQILKEGHSLGHECLFNEKEEFS